MNIEDFKRAKSAALAFMDEHGDQNMPLHALITMCYIGQRTAAATGTGKQAVHDNHLHTAYTAPSATVPVREADSTAPQWLHDALQQFAGKAVTSSAILKAAGRPTDIRSTRQLGTWLRDIAGEPRRSNGQTIFDIPGGQPVAQPVTREAAPQAIPAAKKHDIEDPNHPAIPLRSRAKTWAIGKVGKFDMQSVAASMGLTPDQKTYYELMEGFRELKLPFESGSVILGGPR